MKTTITRFTIALLIALMIPGLALGASFSPAREKVVNGFQLTKPATITLRIKPSDADETTLGIAGTRSSMNIIGKIDGERIEPFWFDKGNVFLSFGLVGDPSKSYAIPNGIVTAWDKLAWDAKRPEYNPLARKAIERITEIPILGEYMRSPWVRFLTDTNDNMPVTDAIWRQYNRFEVSLASYIKEGGAPGMTGIDRNGHSTQYQLNAEQFASVVQSFVERLDTDPFLLMLNDASALMSLGRLRYSKSFDDLAKSLSDVTFSGKLRFSTYHDTGGNLSGIYCSQSLKTSTGEKVTFIIDYRRKTTSLTVTETLRFAWYPKSGSDGVDLTASRTITVRPSGRNRIDGKVKLKTRIAGVLNEISAKVAYSNHVETTGEGNAIETAETLEGTVTIDITTTKPGDEKPTATTINISHVGEAFSGKNAEFDDSISLDIKSGAFDDKSIEMNIKMKSGGNSIPDVSAVNLMRER